MNANELAREIVISCYTSNGFHPLYAKSQFDQWASTPEAKSLIAQLSGVGGMKWVKVKDKTPGQNTCFRQWWENTYPNKTTGRIEPKGEWMYFNGKINEYDEVYDDDGGVNPVDQDTVEWLDESPIPSGEQDEKLMCNQCGGKLVYIRGRYPKQEKRCVCPTCATEKLDTIHEMSDKNYGVAYTSIPIDHLKP